MNLVKHIQTLFPKYVNQELTYWTNISQISTNKSKIFKKQINDIFKIKNSTRRLIALDEKVSSIMSELIDDSGCNIRIHNIPLKFNESQKVTEDILFNTFKTYGPIFAIHLYKSTAYIWFFRNIDAQNLHSTINNMECQSNILKSSFKSHNLLQDCFDWNTSQKYKTFNINGIHLNMNDVDIFWKKI